MNQPSEKPIVVLTGAGISKESGLDTFRDADGIWARIRIEDVATPQAFARDPDAVHAFYNARRGRLAAGEVEPNAAHRALARLEDAWPGEVLLVTQNIDDLHEKAGSRNLLHMHGEMLKVRCGNCATVVGWTGDLGTGETCPSCGVTGKLRPHVVWFGEMPLDMERIYQALDRCRLFLSIGTSGSVYPAAGFVQHVRARAGSMRWSQPGAIRRRFPVRRSPLRPGHRGRPRLRRTHPRGRMAGGAGDRTGRSVIPCPRIAST